MVSTATKGALSQQTQSRGVFTEKFKRESWDKMQSGPITALSNAEFSAAMQFEDEELDEDEDDDGASASVWDPQTYYEDWIGA